MSRSDTRTPIRDALKAARALMACPLCARAMRAPGTCDACGSVEGVAPEMVQRKSRPLFCFDWANGSAAPFIQSDARKFHELVSAAQAATRGELLPDNATFVDLGSGDGAVLFEVLRRFPNARVVGVELSEELCQRAKAEARARRLSDERFSIIQGDLHDEQTVLSAIRGAAVIYLFMLPALLREGTSPMPQLLEDAIATRSAVVISMTWHIPALEPYRVQTALTSGAVYCSCRKAS